MKDITVSRLRDLQNEWGAKTMAETFDRAVEYAHQNAIPKPRTYNRTNTRRFHCYMHETAWGMLTQMKAEWGMSSRAAVVVRILDAARAPIRTWPLRAPAVTGENKVRTRAVSFEQSVNQKLKWEAMRKRHGARFQAITLENLIAQAWLDAGLQPR